jgi:hypothetical protein
MILKILNKQWFRSVRFSVAFNSIQSQLEAHVCQNAYTQNDS